MDELTLEDDSISLESPSFSRKEITQLKVDGDAELFQELQTLKIQKMKSSMFKQSFTFKQQGFTTSSSIKDNSTLFKSNTTVQGDKHSE